MLPCVQFGMTPLMWAAMEGKSDIAELLIKSKSQIDAKTNVRGSGVAVSMWFAK